MDIPRLSAWSGLAGVLLLLVGSGSIGSRGSAPQAEAVLSRSGPNLTVVAETEISESAVLRPMTAERFLAIISEEADDLDAQGNQLQFVIEGQPMVAIADEAHNRMRLVSVITSVEQLTPEQVGNALIANFHTTLDARYAVTDNRLVSVFVHPLNSLQEQDLRSALHQVARAAQNFGTTYSSDAILFGPGDDAQPTTPDIEGNVI